MSNISTRKSSYLLKAIEGLPAKEIPYRVFIQVSLDDMDEILQDIIKMGTYRITDCELLSSEVAISLTRNTDYLGQDFSMIYEAGD